MMMFAILLEIEVQEYMMVLVKHKQSLRFEPLSGFYWLFAICMIEVQ